MATGPPGSWPDNLPNVETPNSLDEKRESFFPLYDLTEHDEVRSGLRSSLNDKKTMGAKDQSAMLPSEILEQ